MSKKKDKYSRIANSYKVTDPGNYCKTAEHISYKSLCRNKLTGKEKARNLCKAIISRDSPFRKCGQQAHVDLKNFYEDCLIDMCTNKNRRQHPRRVQCNILGVLSEVCVESGIPGIKWRTHFKCPKKCRKNEHFTHKASPCPRTCENHFFGTRRPCYDLPEREGCECNKEYIRDGALCVKPMHCNCINLCVDRKDSESCKKWKARGDCEKFQELMNIMCRKTCNFCKQRAQSCENEISTKQCLLFRRQGLCFNEFYRSICGLTCNYDKCKCQDDKVIVEKCNANYIKTTTHYSFARDSNGRCVQTVKKTYRSCCPTDWTAYGNCNFCTGKRNITRYSYDFLKLKCVLRSDTRYENCQKCVENVRENRDCIDDIWLQTTVYFNRLNGCFQCVPDQRISKIEIKCKTTKVVKIINKTTKCTTISTGKPSNCQCHTFVGLPKCCPIRCPGRKTTKHCENGRFVYRTLSYKLGPCKCIPQYSYRTEIPKCQSKLPEFGECLETKNGLFYCKANVTQYTEHVNAHCKCVRKTLKHERTCCCNKTVHIKEKCNRNTGMLTTVYTYYQLVFRGQNYECDKKIYENSTFINFPTQFKKIRGDCKSNYKCTIKIFRLFRDGCKIGISNDTYEETCCCPKQIITRKICVFNRQIVKQFKKELVNDQCIDKLISVKEFPIICPNEQINETKCYNRRITVTTISYYKHKCKCIKKIDTQIKIVNHIAANYNQDCNCTRRVISEKSLGCNNKTGIEIYITVSINERCNYETLVCRYACCKQSVVETRHCSPVTGLITTTIERFYDIKKQFKCFSRTVSTITKPNCNNVKIIKQKCGQERNNYKKITTIRQILSRETCSCKRITTSIWKCCKLPNPIITKSCRGNFLIKVVNYKFDNRKINCIPQISYRIERIQCPSIKVVFKTKKLPNCKYKQTRFYYEIENCKCKLRENSEIYYYSCCKQKPPTVNCVNNTKLVTTSTTFQLSNDRKQCRKYVRKTTQKITCRKLTKSRIKKISRCVIHIITDYYRERNCKCEKYNTKVVKKRICCKNPITTPTCLKNKIWRVTTTKYTKNFENCIKQISFVDIIKKCPPSYSIVFPCRGNSNLITIKRHFYESVNCNCVHRVVRIPCPCHRIPNKVEIGPCRPDYRRTVKVFKSVNNEEGCNWELLESYQDTCICPKISTKRTCLKHSIYRTTTIRQRLVRIPHRFPKHTCVKSKLVSDKIIGCNNNYISQGICINYRKSVTKCVFRTVNCRCELSCRIIRSRPCPCRRFNHCSTTCINNTKTSICYKYRPGRSQCELYYKTAIPIVEKCPQKVDIRCENLNYYRHRYNYRNYYRHRYNYWNYNQYRYNYWNYYHHYYSNYYYPRNNCYYQSCHKSFYRYQNCRCVRHTESSNKCVRCIKPRREIRCSHNRIIAKITNYFIRDNRCHPVQYERVRKTECPRWKVIKTRKHGYTHYKITYYKVENCKCIPKTCQGPIFRKCPLSKWNRKCVNNNQIYTLINREIHSTNRRLCPESGSPIRELICIENRRTRIEPIRCPNSYEIKTCIKSINIRKIKKYYFKVVNCKCVKYVIVDKSRSCKPCHPRPVIIRESSCGPFDANGIGYVDTTTRYWTRNKKYVCEEHITKSKRIGCCRKPRETINECVNGKKIFKTIVREVASQCKPRISIISESIPCYNNGRRNKWVIERIHHCSRPCEFTIKYLVRMQFNPRTCGCRRVRRSVKTDMCLRPCRYRTVCRHNNKIVTISDCQRSEKWKCINYKRETSVDLICPKPVKRVIGDCKGRVFRYRIISYKPVHCRCVKVVKEYFQYLRRDVTICNDGIWNTTHIGYELYRNRCVPKRPEITFTPVFCPKFETFRDKRINKCDFSRSYFRKFVSNCLCVDRFVRKEILHYKCCQKPIISKRCVNHNTRLVVTINFKLLNFKCYPVRRESRFPVDCSHLKFQENTITGVCTYKTVHYYAATRNCACYKIPKFTRFNLKFCCFPIPSPVTSCDNRRGVLITVIRRYKLVKHKCIPRISTIEKPVDCDGRICETRYGKCIRNTQTVEMFCLKREGCKCVKQILTRRNVCCGPNKDSTWTKIGPCTERGDYYKLITTYALRLNYRTNQCRPVVIRYQYRLCYCRKSFVNTSCSMNIYMKTIGVSYKMDKPKNVCHKTIDESMVPITRCYKTSSIVMDERETTPDGWCIRTIKITTPVNCKCIERIEKTRFKCPCYKQVDKVRRRYCDNNDIIVDETRIPKCRLNNIYWTIERTFTRIVKCSHVQVLQGPTFPLSRYRGHTSTRFCTRMRYDTYVQWYVDICKCRNKLIKQRPWCTVCRLPRQIEHCLGSNINVIRYSYSIVDGICRRTVAKKLVHVPCPTRSKVHVSRCINNIYTITTTHYYYDNCRCRSREERKTCHCKCGKDSKEIKCSRNYFLNEITTRYYKRDCRCVKTVNIRQIEPSCPRFIYFSVGKCNIQNHYSIYRKLTVRRIDRNYRNCKCVVVEKSENEVCSCRRRRLEIGKEITKRNFCSNNNNFVIQTWERRINIRKNKCEKVITHIDSKIISCPPTRIEKVCKVDRAIGKEITTKYNLVNCKCIERKFARRIPCPCTPKQPVLKHRGVCNYITRRRIDVYWHKEARGKHCVTVIENKPVLCSCLPEKQMKKCTNNRVAHIHTYFTLVNNSCQKRKIVRYDYVFCNQKVWKVEKNCDAHGFKTIEYYEHILRNCICVRERIAVDICRCRCPQNRMIRKCHSSGKSIINIRIFYKLVSCSCKMMKTKNIQPIQCPSRTVSVSGCKEVRCRGYWFRTTTFTNYHIRHCICVRNVQTIKTICKIKIFKEFSVTCDRKRRLEIIKESKLIFKNGKCVRITSENRIPITCNNNRWVIVGRSTCDSNAKEFRSYERLYFKDCRCLPERKERLCDCRCKSPFVVKKCEGNINRLYYYRYELRRCKCNRQLIRVQTKRIYCKSKILKVGPCFEKHNRCVRNVEYQQSIVINCQCIKRRRIIQRICHSCCQHSTKTKTSCKCDAHRVTEVTSCRVNQYGRIIRTTQVTSKGVACDEGTTCVSQNDCDYLTSTETFKCTTKSLEKCLCVTKTEVIKKDLCNCGLPKLKFGACDLKSCKREVYQIENKLVILRNNKKTCENVVRKLRDEICCCPKSTITKKCLYNGFIQKTEKNTFNEAEKTCESRSSENDITETCGPEREEFQKTFISRTFKKKIIIITRRLVNCKCITRRTIKWELYRCPGSRTETKCVRNKLEIIRHKYTLNNKKNKCILTVDKRTKQIVCPALRRDLFKFSINSLEQCRKIFYEVHNCRCILFIIPQRCPCTLSCPKDTVTESCFHGQGVYRIVRRNYKFDNEGCKCTSIIRTEDKQIRCEETPRNVIVRAAYTYWNGIYDYVTTVFERRYNCACIKHSSSRYVLNSCYYGYQRSGSHNIYFDYTCVKIYVPPPPVQQPSSNSYRYRRRRRRRRLFFWWG